MGKKKYDDDDGRQIVSMDNIPTISFLRGLHTPVKSAKDADKEKKCKDKDESQASKEIIKFTVKEKRAVRRAMFFLWLKVAGITALFFAIIILLIFLWMK